MKDSAPVIAYASLLILGGALGGVVFLGTRPGPSTPPGSSTSSTTTAPATPSTPSTPSTAPATPSTPSTPSTPATPATPGALTFVPSADLSQEEQGILERINEVRGNPPAFLPDWKASLAHQVQKGLSCNEPDSMLDPLKTYTPRQALAANQQLTTAARGHARDQLMRAYTGHVNPEGLGSNQRIVAAGYPLPLGAHINGYTYGKEKDAVNTESIYASMASTVTTFGAPAFVESIDMLIVDTCIPSRGHRDHVLGVIGTSPVENEIGVGAITDVSPKTKHSELRVVLETATKNDGKFYVLGVIFRDTDSDGKFDIGEGVPGVQIDVAAAGVTTKTGPGGGYALPVADGISGELTTGGGAKQAFAIKGGNAKIDIIVP